MQEITCIIAGVAQSTAWKTQRKEIQGMVGVQCNSDGKYVQQCQRIN